MPQTVHPRATPTKTEEATKRGETMSAKKAEKQKSEKYVFLEHHGRTTSLSPRTSGPRFHRSAVVADLYTPRETRLQPESEGGSGTSFVPPGFVPAGFVPLALCQVTLGPWLYACQREDS